MLMVHLAVYWAMQILGNVAFKLGSNSDKSRKWLAAFIAGNMSMAGSIYFLMKIYESMPDNCNLALILAGSGAGIGGQIVLARIFKSRLSRLQWCGIFLCILGAAVVIMGGQQV